MNIIDNQRETIILENNTAQKYLLGFIENLTRRTSILELKETLHGDLDFSVLRNSGFMFIHTIILPEGEITSIQNIPDGITHFSCANNFLVNLENLPSTLQHIDVGFNYLDNIDLTPCKVLAYARLSNNRLKKIENLPHEISELHLDHNELSFLKLSGMSKLKTLNVSNNKIAIVESLPETLVDFQMENNPSIQFVNSPVVPIKQKEDAIEQEVSYIESLNAYFLMKGNYENAVHEMKKRVFRSAPNKKIGKKRVLEIKPKCVHCSRPVGTIFTVRDNRYKAICGDAVSPCNLNIELYKGDFSAIMDLIYTFKEDMESVKENIICLKLDTLFDYISEQQSVPLFKEALEQYNIDMRILKELIDTNDENHLSESKRDIIDRKRNKIFLLKEQIANLLKEYEKTQNREILKTAMTLQIDSLLPETRNLRLLTNELMEVNEKKYTNGKIEYYLFQYPIALTKIDHNIDEPPRVIKFAK
jgi:hypothetical protein